MSEQLAHITFISAGAGSGKTYRLTEELERALADVTARLEARDIEIWTGDHK